MVSNKFFFHVRVPCPLHQKYIQGKEVLINIDNCQNSNNSSTKYYSSKTFCILRNVLWIFFPQIYFKANFLYCPRIFVLTKNFNTVCTPTKINITCCIGLFLVKIVVSFVKILNIIIEEYNLFLSHIK